MKKLNKREEMFVDMLDIIWFYLQRGRDKDGNVCYYLMDKQHANLADIQSEQFNSAEQIIDRLEVYEYDYIINDLKECALWENISIQYDTWEDILKYRSLMPNNQYEFDLIDMICNHSQDIDIEKVYNSITA